MHRAMKRGFFERRDAIMCLQASLFAAASLGSSKYVKFETAEDAVRDSRAALMRTVFPYLEAEPHSQEEDANAIFDEIDRLNAGAEDSALAGKSANDIIQTGQRDVDD